MRVSLEDVVPLGAGGDRVAAEFVIIEYPCGWCWVLLVGAVCGLGSH